MSRKARVCTISMNSLLHGRRSTREDRFREAEDKMKLGSLDRPDLYLLPEHFLVNDEPGCYTNPANIDEPGNDAYRRIGALARGYNAYIAAALLTRIDGKVRNSIVLFDRKGVPVFNYYKTHPTPTEIEQGVSPGPHDPETFDADFGRIGVAICYDLNFQHIFRHYNKREVELLLFSSYFPGGLLLQSWCHLYNFHAVTSHAQGYESAFYDNMGYEIAQADMFNQAYTRALELDSVVVPYWGNREEIAAAKQKYGPDLELDVHRAEGDAIIRYLSSATSARDIMTEFRIRSKAQCYNDEHLL